MLKVFKFESKVSDFLFKKKNSLCEPPKKVQPKKTKKVDKENKENSNEPIKKEVKKRAKKEAPVSKQNDETVPLIKTIVKELKNIETNDVIALEDTKDDAPAIIVHEKEAKSEDTEMETDDVDIIEYCFSFLIQLDFSPYSYSFLR